MSLIQAADDARRLLRGFKAFDQVAAALDQVGTLEQRAAEAQRVLDDLAPKLAEGNAAVDAARAQADEILTTARAAADKLQADASANATAMVETARGQAEAREAQAQAAVDAATQQAADAQTRRDLMAGERDALAIEAADLATKVAQAKAYLAKLAG